MRRGGRGESPELAHQLQEHPQGLFLQATAQQRDVWETAAKGGTFWHRTLTASKWMGIGAAVGVVVGYGAHK